jgi:hypothetical protein
MLKFSKYLKEVKQDYTPEELDIFKQKLDNYNEELSIMENQIFSIQKKQNEILKEKNKLQAFYSQIVTE